MFVRSLTVGFVLGLGVASASADTLNRGNSGSPTTLDPQRAVSVFESNILTDLFEGLVAPGADGSPVAGAADHWSVDETGLVWVFDLRDEASWSDGSPVVAQDFVTAFRRLVDPATGSPNASILTPVEGASGIIAGEADAASLGVVALSEAQLEIRLQTPTPYFLDLLTSHSTLPVPSHLLTDGTLDTDPGDLVSNGAYTLVDLTLGSETVLEANPHYWDADSVAIDRVVFHGIEDRGAALRRFQAGELDYNNSVPLDMLALIKDETPENLWVSPRAGSYFYALNPAIPGLEDPRVRRALSLLVDRDVLIDLAGGSQQPGYSFVPPGTANYGDPAELSFADLPMFEREERARQLLAEAGFGADGEKLSYQLRFSNADNHRRWAVAIAGMWAEAGIEVELLGTDIAAHWQHLMTGGSFEIARAGWLADVNDPYDYLRSMLSENTTFNYPRWMNPEYDELVLQAAATSDLAVRADLFRQAEAILLAADVVIPLFFPVNTELVSERLVGWQPNMGMRHRSRYARFAE